MTNTNNSNREGGLAVFDFKGTEIRTITRDGKPWFVAPEVCKILGIKNPSQAVQALDEDERSMLNIGRQGAAVIISESGLYALIFKSRKPVAKAFRKWVTNEVLPAIRETGGYSVDESILPDPASMDFEGDLMKILLRYAWVNAAAKRMLQAWLAVRPLGNRGDDGKIGLRRAAWTRSRGRLAEALAFAQILPALALFGDEELA